MGAAKGMWQQEWDAAYDNRWDCPAYLVRRKEVTLVAISDVSDGKPSNTDTAGSIFRFCQKHRIAGAKWAQA